MALNYNINYIIWFQLTKPIKTLVSRVFIISVGIVTMTEYF